MSRETRRVRDRIRQYLGFDLYDDLSEQYVIIAGGAVLSSLTGDKINDIDLYLTPLSNLSEVRELLEEYKYKLVYETPNALTYRKGFKCVQIITRFELNAMEDIVKTFDISVSACAFDFNRVYTYDSKGLLTREAHLINVGIDLELATLGRVRKYTKRGYSFPDYTSITLACKYCSKFKNGEEFNYPRFKKDMEVVDAYYEENPDIYVETYNMICDLLDITPISRLAIEEYENEENYE